MDLNAENILKLVEQNKDNIRSFGVKRLALVGSFARGEQTDQSDIDFLVEFSRKTFDSFMDLIFFLEDLLNREVGLVIADSAKEKLVSSMMEDAIDVQGL